MEAELKGPVDWLGIRVCQKEEIDGDIQVVSQENWKL